MAKILYAACCCGPDAWRYLQTSSVVRAAEAPQKFHRLMISGLARNLTPGDVTVVSSVPVSPGSHTRVLWSCAAEESNGVLFKHLPFINVYFMRQACVALFSFLSIIGWFWKNRTAEKFIIADAVTPSLCLPGGIAAWLLRIPLISVVTDLPSVIYDEKNSGVFSKLLLRILRYQGSALPDGYVLLAPALGPEVNPKGRPSILLEGLVDDQPTAIRSFSPKGVEKIIHYAGGLYEAYGIRNLLDAFRLIEDSSVRLHLFGFGDMVPIIKKYAALDSRIRFFGAVANEEVINDQSNATLLLNPRPPTLEAARFSFPSKNMEYMASGTPLLTTRLPGMPADHENHVYILDSTEPAAMAHRIKSLLALPQSQLRDMGSKAREFVLAEKSSTKQAKRVLSFLSEVVASGRRAV